MKLLGSKTSPFVRKVRVVLAEKKLDYHWVLENVWASDSQIKQSNPLGQVPCLITDAGEAIFDSRVIVEYLDGLSPVTKLIPLDGRARIEVKTWEALADGVLDAAVSGYLEQHWAGRQAHERSQAWVDRQLDKIQSALQAMDKGLGSNTWCAGQRFSLADIAVGSALAYLDLRFPQVAWRQDFSTLKALMERLALRPSFQLTCPSN